jgi:hypothetical protein
MRFNGEWFECDDGIVRPIIRAEVLSRDRLWTAADLLVDTGADRTVLSADLLKVLSLETSRPQHQIGGIGGLIESVTVTTHIRLTRDDGQGVTFHGSYAGCTRYDALDMSVVGRDILEMFSVIVDRPADVVAILGGNHYYSLHQR